MIQEKKQTVDLIADDVKQQGKVTIEQVDEPTQHANEPMHQGNEAMHQIKDTMQIDRVAILHIPLSRYAFASSEHTLTIRLRARKGNLTACTLYYGDRAYNCSPVKFTAISMHVQAQDEYFEYFEATFLSPYSRVCYYFKLEKEEEWTYYYADRFTKKLADLWISGKLIEGRSEYYQYPFILKEEVVDVPDWFKNAVVYNIFPDSFASGYRKISESPTEVVIHDGISCKTRLGGTIRGIRENLDYIESLGVNCIYLNPIFVAGEYHKYDILDYYHIDPCLGSDSEFGDLVEDIHLRGMRLIIDGVFNHCSWKFFAFEDVIANGEESVYKDWFYELKFPVVRPKSSKEKPNYTCFAYERKMPKLNTSNPQVQKYFAEVGKYWIQKYQVDGWRLDVANEVDRNFWRKFRKAVKEEKKDAVLIGEVWEEAETWLRGDAFDSTMNYDFRRILKEFLGTREIDAKTAAERLEQMRLRYPTNLVNGQLNLLDSHDVPRFLSLCQGDMLRWKLAFILLMLFPGVPSLFYGDEKELTGITEAEYRRPMVWDGRKTSTTDFVIQMIQIRKQYLDGHTDYEPIWSQMTDQLFAFRRKGSKGQISVFMNAGDQTQTLPQSWMSGRIVASSMEEGKPAIDCGANKQKTSSSEKKESLPELKQIEPWGYLILVE